MVTNYKEILNKLDNLSPNGDWQQIWDALYWRFIDLNREIFAKNIRMKFMVSMLDKMQDEKRINHFKIANEYLDSLDK